MDEEVVMECKKCGKELKPRKKVTEDNSKHIEGIVMCNKCYSTHKNGDIIIKDKLDRKNKKCEFPDNGIICPWEVVGIARCKYLCKLHFTTTKNDNIRKFNRGEEITKDMKYTRKLLYSETASMHGDKSNYY